MASFGHVLYSGVRRRGYWLSTFNMSTLSELTGSVSQHFCDKSWLALGFSHVICWFACMKESLCAHCIWSGLQEPVAGCAAESCDVSSLTQKPGDGLSHLVGCLFFLLCCRRVLLWKRRGSITMCPHTPQRPRAEASINLLSLCRAYRACI